MARKPITKTQEENTTPMATRYVDQFKHAYDFYQPYRTKWDEYEALIISKNLESTKNTAKSQVFDPKLITMQFDRSWRVMAQMQTGRVKELSRGDKGKAALMDLVLKHYVEVNANSQRDILTKFRMMNFYSNVYGSIGALVDYVVKDSYIGPDFWLIPMRDLILQPQKATVEDSEYVYIVNRVSRQWLANLLKKEGGKWNKEAIRKLLDVSKGDKTQSISKYGDDRSYIERQNESDFSEQESEFQMIRLATRYTKDRWCTFAIDYPSNQVLREIANPHGNDKIPVVVKDSIPLLDRYPATSDVERGLSLQYADNSLWNLYLDGVAASIFPPLIIKQNEVVPQTIKYEKAAKWVLQPNGNADSIRTHQFSPQGINTFQATHPALVSAILNLGGTTDTTVSAVTDPSLGKTPAAIDSIMQRQNARDASDRFLQEQAINKIYDIFVDLIVAKQEKPIEIAMFEKEIENIANSSPDVLDMLEYTEKGGIMISPEKLKDASYKYYIDAGSTLKKDEAQEKQAATDVVKLIFEIPGAVEQAMQTGQVKIGDKALDFGELIKRVVVTSGMQDAEKIIVEGAGVVQPQQPQDMGMQGGMPQDTQGMNPQQDMQQMQQPMSQVQQQPMQRPMNSANFDDPMLQETWESIVGGR